MTTTMFFSQLLFWTIVVMAYFLMREFYRWNDGRLRLLFIELFLAKIWCYGLAGGYYLLWDLGHLHNWNLIWLRIACNAPMMITMVRLYLFIRSRNKKAPY